MDGTFPKVTGRFLKTSEANGRSFGANWVTFPGGHFFSVYVGVESYVRDMFVYFDLCVCMYVCPADALDFEYYPFTSMCMNIIYCIYLYL